MVPYFVIAVDMYGGKSPHPSKNPHGWIVSRNLNDFSALHQKLIQVSIIPGLYTVN